MTIFSFFVSERGAGVPDGLLSEAGQDVPEEEGGGRGGGGGLQ